MTIQDVQLSPIPPYNLTVNVVEFGTGAPISNAQILLNVPLIDHLGNTNGIGQEDFVLFYQENYFITVGKWGYYTKCFDQILDQNTGQITVVLEKGYQDEFTFDFGWTTSGTAITGTWERGKPNGSSSGSAPSIDSDLDCGINCFVTGNDMTQHPDSDDVDGGYTLLTSPIMDLTSYTDPHLFYRRWFYCEYGAPPDDTLKVAVSNGFTTVVIDEIGPYGPQFYQWVPRSIRLSDFLTITNSMQVTYFVSDFDPAVNVTEAGIDYFLVTNTDVLDVAEENRYDFQVFPNPFATEFTIQNAEIGAHLTVFNAQGVSVHKQEVKTKSVQLELPHVPSGLYFIKINNQVKKVMKH